MSVVPDRSTTSDPQPAWEVALLFPSQGDWSEFEYLSLDTSRMVELIDGSLKVLPMPSVPHQAIVIFLFEALKKYIVARSLGTVMLAPLPIQIRQKTFREPDVFYFSDEHVQRPDRRYLSGANLVMEVVSPDSESHDRDYLEKRVDYAALKIPEYWIVDPQTEQITVLALSDGQYRVGGVFAPGERALSNFLPDFSLDVAAVFDAGKA